jgi:predicted ATP-dependent serine protease
MTGKRQRRQREFFVCPHCGAEVAVTAKVCRECGSDADTGWQSTEEVEYQSLDLPQGYRADEAHESNALPPSRPSKWFVFVVLLMLVLFVLGRVLRGI